MLQLLWRALLLASLFCLTSQDPIPPSQENLKERFSEALDAIMGVGLRLHALLEDPEAPNTKNFLISPLSAAVAVGQLMVGAEGPFLQQLHNLLSVRKKEGKYYTIHVYSKTGNLSYSLPYGRLHLQLGSLLQTLERRGAKEDATLHSANALFVDNHLNLRQDFIKKMEMYNTEVQSLNFTSDPGRSKDLINEWASKNTNGKISSILSSIPSSASAVLANAVYFLAKWATPFSNELNTKGSFHSSEAKQVEVTYMRGFFESIPYSESKKLNCRMIGLPYKNNEVTMYILLPIENVYDIRGFVRNLKARDVLEFLNSTKKHDVILQLPKMSLTSTVSILEPLQKYSVFARQNPHNQESGVDVDVIEEGVDQFASFRTNETADVALTAAAENGALRVSKILQQIILSVNEQGTEAAAVTSGTIDYIGGSKTFRVERPFMFFIRHEATSAILFWGAIVDPTQSYTEKTPLDVLFPCIDDYDVW